MVLRRFVALLLIVLAGCSLPKVKAEPGTPAPSPVDLMAATQALAFDLAFFEAQGDSGIAIDVAREFDRKTGCTSSWTLGYWQESQRAEEVVARAGVMVDLKEQYSYVAAAVHDALLALPYTATDGTEQEADFVGVIAAVRC